VPGVGSRGRCRGKRTAHQLGSIKAEVAAYRAEVEEAALGTPAAEVLDIEDDAEVIFRAVYQHDTETSGGYILSPCSIVNEGVVANT
jgi:hypothetical protein